MSSGTRQLDGAEADLTSRILDRPAHSALGQAARVLYWLGIGWWAAWIWTQLAWLMNLSFVGASTSLWMLNHLPQVLLCRGGLTSRDPIAPKVSARQHPWAWRALYFLLVGWWLGWLWANLGWALSVTLLGLPLGLLVLSYLPAITTLRIEE